MFIAPSNPEISQPQRGGIPAVHLAPTELGGLRRCVAMIIAALRASARASTSSLTFGLRFSDFLRTSDFGLRILKTCSASS